jgi:hypothetical protein
MTLLFSLSSCLKKGENDPSISLRTRKARVVGKWKLESGTNEFRNVYNGTTGEHYDKLITTYSGNTYQSRYESANSSTVSTGTVSHEVEFKKNGEFSSVVISNNRWIRTLKGTWSFTGNVGEHKNKDQIVINLSSDSSEDPVASSPGDFNFSYMGNRSDITYSIKELRNKKITLVSENFTTDKGSETSGNYSELTFVQ